VPDFWSRRLTLPPRCAIKEQGPMQNLRLELVLDTRDDPIQGRIGHPHAEAIPFIGWLELMAALQRLTAPGPDATAAPPRDPEARSR